MKKSGFFGIACLNMKTHHNYGTLFRTAQILGADYLCLIGSRFKKQASDTMCSWRHIPVFEFKDFKDFNNHRPYNCPLIGVEMVEEATEISQYKHKKTCCYILGAEDHGLTNEAIEHCQEFVKLKGERSMNVSTAGSIVLYDRIVKLQGDIVK